MAIITTSTKGLWMLHGVLVGVAWGVLARLAIGSVFLCNHFTFLKSNARWLRLHFYLADLVVIFTAVGYAVAIAAADDDGTFEENELFDDDVHSGMGLAILGMVILQAIAGFVRPKPVANPISSPAEDNNEGIFDDKEKHAEEGSMEMETNGENDTDATPPTKCKMWIRKLWEYTHRLLGILLLCLTWFNCHSGIFLLAEYYGPIDNLVKLF
jgi:hypothetical protein